MASYLRRAKQHEITATLPMPPTDSYTARVDLIVRMMRHLEPSQWKAPCAKVLDMTPYNPVPGATKE
jgi:hypothetical protein